ncbi:hypothetical protein [Zoogloea sp.]|uniref:hypothetical protein n=1 Tax=Zoogloea sp. TaxID=49181 RepID=UPI0014157BE6|nr:MAG: hypothetical protein F9K15_18405 [Zoogloea sp.]
MKQIISRVLCVACTIFLAACVTAGAPGAPSDSQVARIQAACATDAAIRPSVTVLLTIPGLATPEQAAGIAAARAVIDPICAHPEAGLQGNSAAALAGAVGQVVAYVAQMQRAADPGPGTK